MGFYVANSPFFLFYLFWGFPNSLLMIRGEPHGDGGHFFRAGEGGGFYFDYKFQNSPLGKRVSALLSYHFSYHFLCNFKLIK